MAEMTMTQMNTRIDAALKERGDAVLARAGFTPSAAVRALWRFAVAHERDPHAIAELLEAQELDEETRAQRQAKIDALHQGRGLIEEFYAKHGLTEDDPFASLSYKELRDMCYRERLEEKDARSVCAS